MSDPMSYSTKYDSVMLSFDLHTWCRDCVKHAMIFDAMVEQQNLNNNAFLLHSVTMSAAISLQ